MAGDPYRYFRIEAQELVEALSRGFLDLEKRADAEQVRSLLRHAHTLKGAARVVKLPEIAQCAHAIEDLLAPYRDHPTVLGAELVGGALAQIDRITELTACLGQSVDTPHGAGQRRTSESLGPEVFDHVRIAVGDMDRMLESVEAALAASRSLTTHQSALDDSIALARALSQRATAAASSDGFGALVDRLQGTQRHLTESLERGERELVELRALASDLRLVPAQVLIAELERTARDTGQTLGKPVAFRARGGETRLDAHVLAGLRGGLRHVVRNAVDHGIEDPETRAAAGKPESGVVEVVIERRGHRVALSCRDDGRGVDVDSARRAAVARGLLSETAAAALRMEEVIELLVRGGVSTAHAVTQISGRGVGLDVVRRAVEGLEGELAIKTSPGGGTTVELVVPVSLTSLPALVLEVGKQRVLVPLDSVRSTLRLAEGDVTMSTGRQCILCEGQPVPLLDLARALQSPPRTGGVARTAVVLCSQERLAALQVERLCGIEVVIVRAIPDCASASALVAGAALDESGLPRLVLSPGALVDRACSRVAPADPTPVRGAPRVLVVDDSVTTRMLEQSILEAAGYDVDLASSGEEGLRRAGAGGYALFLVDVEMPGMSGLEFVRRVQSDPALRQTPSILVTSLASPDDIRRGEEVGARAYIVKSQFDQRVLIDTIRRLVG